MLIVKRLNLCTYFYYFVDTNFTRGLGKIDIVYKHKLAIKFSNQTVLTHISTKQKQPKTLLHSR